MDSLRTDDPRQIGPYRLEGRLGAGGMGEVFLGASAGGRKVAVKIVREEFAASARFRARFAREIEAARKVGGFHTAQVVDADAEAESPWMATAFVPGPSLQQRVRREGPLDPPAVRALGAGLAEGLAAIHACGLVHRDLKPGNVIMAPDGPRIIDFGIARPVEGTSLTSTGTVLGTFAFMSPEQVRAAGTGPASDVFSFGCVLAYAATGKGPFDAATVPAIVHRIVSGQPTLDGLDGDLRHLVEQCLAKDPDQRPPVPEVLARLTAAPLTTAPPAVARRALLVGAAAVGATAVTGTAAVLLWPDMKLRNAPKTPRGTPTGTALPSVTPEIIDLAFSADGRSLLGAGFETLSRWDLATGQDTPRKFEDEQVFDRPMVLGPDGRRLATGGKDGAVHLWDVASGTSLKVLAQSSAVRCLAFSPDGRTIAVSNESGPAWLQLWNSATGKVTKLSASGEARAMAFSPDGKKLAFAEASSGALTLYDLPDGEVAWRDTDEKGKRGSDVDALAFSPDGGTLAVPNSLDWSIELRRTRNGKVRDTLKGHRDLVCGLVFSPDGDTLVSASDDKTIALWHVPSRRRTAVVEGPGGRSGKRQALVFGPDGKSFAVASDTVKLWTFR